MTKIVLEQRMIYKTEPIQSKVIHSRSFWSSEMLVFYALVAILATIFYYAFVRPLNYWKQRGVKQGTTLWIFGDYFNQLVGLGGFPDHFKMLYDRFPRTRYYGSYNLTKPKLVVRDPELIKRITVKDFEHFTDHQEFIPPEAEILWSNNVFALRGQKWRDMRLLLTPTFTSSKIKNMFSLASESIQSFVKFVNEKNEALTEIDLRDAMGRVTNDIIATMAFGLKTDSLRDPENDFYVIGQDISNNFLTTFKFFAFSLFAGLLSFFKVPFLPAKTRNFFLRIVNETIKIREEKKIVRPDVIHLLMEAKKTSEQQKDSKHKVMTNTDIASQAFLYYLGGFDTVSSLLTFLLYEITVNEAIQARLRNEILEAKRNCGGTLTYDAVMEMKYLDMVVSESLRKWPAMVQMNRECTKPYTIDPVLPHESPLTLEVGTTIIISNIGLQRDPKYFPNPDKFDPERFNEENKDSIDPYVNMPFGAGPRNCIGSRFSLMTIKLVITLLLSNFEVVPVKKTAIPVIISKKAVGIKPEGQLVVGFKKIC